MPASGRRVNDYSLSNTVKSYHLCFFIHDFTLNEMSTFALDCFFAICYPIKQYDRTMG